ncbi:Cobyrinic acid a,c-diamide synthase [Hyella patelloides LEGE 07179]|uniref:Cobyrinic acid a,c-diamide synthase n=1 Tax=Hyella patelloides LEGE 07179 TaxID=945734 RepID=A0A563VW72_9CYAN|nr:ParA family protein [Hyella patelloides]VEP15645.1 Cobyrinic acid a,c-diamide synthase [Hyella patelloides LEGE 07179]
MSKIIALFNQAGGVAKTTLTMNLGYHLSQISPPRKKQNYRVLLIDLDPQATLTNFMGLEPEQLESTIYDAVIDQKKLPIHSDIHGLDLVPASVDLSSAELELVVADMRDLRLKYALEPIQNNYDFILLDCPPSLGILSYIALVASTHVLVPIQTQYKSFLGAELLLSTVTRVRSLPNRHLQIAGFIPSMYDARNTQDERTLNAIQEQLAILAPVYKPIPRSTAFADAAEDKQPLAIFQPKHPAVKILKQIAIALTKLS